MIDCASVHRVVALIFDHELRITLVSFHFAEFQFAEFQLLVRSGLGIWLGLSQVKSNEVGFHRHTVPLYPHYKYRIITQVTPILRSVSGSGYVTREITVGPTHLDLF